MNNRIAIFCFYDKNGVVDSYVEYLLSQMSLCVKKLVIVINGECDKDSFDLFKKYTEFVFIRENKGYDGGAYKDTILKYLKDEDWSSWDELVLLNDTFYGPLYPWKKIFTKMKNVDADFWGLSRCAGIDRYTKKGRVCLPEHIQSFFIVCNKSILNTAAFIEFWKGLEYPRNYDEAIEWFEVGFSTFFKQRGFKSSSYLEEVNPDLQLEHNQVIFLEKPGRLVKELAFPIIKKKAMSLYCFNEAIDAYTYVKNNTQYDISMILQNLKRLDEAKEIKPLSPILLEEFYKSHNRIYIYGRGNWSKGITEFFQYKGWKFEKYIVTENTGGFLDTVNYRDVTFEKEDGLILALGEENLAQVYEVVRNDLSESQIFVPIF